MNILILFNILRPRVAIKSIIDEIINIKSNSVR
jgi:hypothetical protein